MKIITKKLELETRGNPDLIDITPLLRKVLETSGLKEGSLLVFVSGSTAGITTFEYEPGLIRDMEEIYEKLVPAHKSYHHDNTWGDANGFSHIRSALQGPSLVIPFAGGKLLLGVWQQVVLAEFDNHPRKREIVVQITGE
ncbi:MAG: secondary thiamine-phosphate synthase enzyme YjbQ [Candidatus Omnitrophota bacterium]